jgi:hypothetical protein
MIRFERCRIKGNDRTHVLLYGQTLCGIKQSTNMNVIANGIPLTCQKCSKYYSRMKKIKKEL